tara:strand:+ start:530 stop:1114 length:585 start_codon:yes stop_codon:yes gene_type:complete
MFGAPGYIQVKGMVDRRLREFKLKMYPQAVEPIGDDTTYVASAGDMGMGLYAKRNMQTGELVARYRAPGEAVETEDWLDIYRLMHQQDPRIVKDSAVGYARPRAHGGDKTLIDGGWVPGSEVPKWWRMNHGPNPNVTRKVGDDGMFYWYTKDPVTADDELKWNYGDVPKEWNAQPRWGKTIKQENVVSGKRRRS